MHTTPHVHFNVLGPLEIWDGERRIKPGGPVNERVLAMLLLEAGRVVPVSRLIQAAWDQEPPPTAVHQIRKAVAGLRRRLPSGHELITTEPPGYRAVLSDGQLDLRMFDIRVRRAQEARTEGLPDNAVMQLKAGLDLWRGPVLGGTGGPVIDAVAAAWEERRLAATEQGFELRLEQGEASGLIGELREAVTAHPYGEVLRGQLLLALYRAGRQTEALEEYTRLRISLAEEIGIDPGPKLAALYEAILRGDPELDAPPAPQDTQEPPLAVTEAAPCTLPYDLADFTGRQEEMRRLTAAPPATGERTSPHILVVDGMGGSGKTALAVHAAHRLADSYPDGQLYLDLRGFTPGEEPLSPGTALGVLLRAMGVAGKSVAEYSLSRCAQWRVTSAHRRLLLVLDNAADAAQVRPLLPASPGSLVLITSRVGLPELEGAQELSLGLLTDEDSVELMSRILGADRVAAEPDATASLVQLCGRLPLALRVSAARLRKRPHWTLRHLAERLGDDTRILGELESGDRSVATVLRMSYDAMKPEHRAHFRLLSLHPGTGFAAPVAAALLDTDPHSTERILEYLLDVHLLMEFEFGRYSFHDLVHSFARTLPADEAEQREAAVLRLAERMLTELERACDALFPGRVRYGNAPAADDGTKTPPPEPQEAQRWFTQEWRNVVAVVHLADQYGLHWHAAWLSRGIGFYLHTQSYFSDFEQMARLAVDNARKQGDPELLCVSLINLAVAQWHRDLFQEGIASSEEALAIASGLADPRTEAACLSRLGVLCTSVGRLEDAVEYLARASEAHRVLCSAREEAQALANLCFARERLGRLPEAVRAGQRAAALAWSTGDAGIEVTALANLSLAHLGLERLEDAAHCLTRARALCEPLRAPALTSLVLCNLAEAELRAGRPHTAHDHGTAALDLARGHGSRARQAAAENMLGRVDRAQGEHRRAVGRHRTALEQATAIGLRTETVRAHRGLAESLRTLGDAAAADWHDRAAREHATAMALPPDAVVDPVPAPGA
ncbi:BTAD domain-containing putative transcriptional regulator [Streptomyces sp. NPDC058371]|uniref:AfsR/SARP family transcriptional regulator n=1 Tax=Streptomyces sp. NPDC058371 TaxID=3346463 RepID=UPI0036514FAC